MAVDVHGADGHDARRLAACGEVAELACLRRGGSLGKAVDHDLRPPALDRAAAAQELVSGAMQVLDLRELGRLVGARMGDRDAVPRVEQVRDCRQADRARPAHEESSHGGHSRVRGTAFGRRL
jgi:hypothetical protein